MTPSTFEKEMKKFDRLLRLRRAKLGSWYFIERKARRGSTAVPKPAEGKSIDRWIRDTQGYVLIVRMRHRDLTNDFLLRMRDADMWEKRHGRFGAEGVIEDEIRKELERDEYKEKKDSERLQDEGTEIYDKHMSRQGDVVYPGLKGNVAGVKK